MARLARLARQARFRRDEGCFVLDGPTLLSEALAADITVEEVFVEPGATDRPEVEGPVAAAAARGARVWTVTGGLKGHVDTATPNGLAAVARVPEPAGADVPDGPALVLVLVGVSDPGNAGTLVRTAEAAGASVVLTRGSVDPWSPKVVRSSAGSVLRVPIRTGADGPELLHELAADGVRPVAATVRGGRPAEEVDLTGPVALVLGGEAHGLDPDLAAGADEHVSLPMGGSVESLNVAVAGSVLAFEALRQRRVAP